jgi:pheromone shutdown-related protein TraB
MKHKNITLLGTSHIAQGSVNEIINTIETSKPDIVAVELDKNRLAALLQKGKRPSLLRLIGKIGVTGMLFALIGAYMQRKLGKIVGVQPGEDMLAAVKTAGKHKLPLFLIDQNIEVTLARFSKFFTWREKFRLLKDIFMALFFQKRQLKKYGFDTIDLTSVPPKKLIHQLIGRVKEEYPSVYQVVIHERDMFMSLALIGIVKEHPDKQILAVVGAGHEEGMMEFLKSNV